MATDGDTGDDITGYAITGGADQTFFSIGATSGALTFDDAPNFEDAEDQGTDNTYVVEVATQTITVDGRGGEAPAFSSSATFDRRTRPRRARCWRRTATRATTSPATRSPAGRIRVSSRSGRRPGR